MPTGPRTLLNQAFWLRALLVLIAVDALIDLLSYGYSFLQSLLLVSRSAVVAALSVYACLRRSLMTWIFACMVIGGVMGHDFPRQAIALQIVTQIFLRLIKAIIAPLIFSTLVVGIAGHSDLKQVGRMGVKALIYFEIVTTLALFIGLGAINLSRAGVGVQQPAMQLEEVKTVKQSAADVVLPIFPENIAKSVAEGEVLQ